MNLLSSCTRLIYEWKMSRLFRLSGTLYFPTDTCSCQIRTEIRVATSDFD